LSEEAKEALLNYEFKGNIRELINIMERAAILSEGEKIKSSDLNFL
jgi:two-component system NtrC family response regulator